MGRVSLQDQDESWTGQWHGGRLLDMWRMDHLRVSFSAAQYKAESHSSSRRARDVPVCYPSAMSKRSGSETDEGDAGA